MVSTNSAEHVSVIWVMELVVVLAAAPEASMQIRSATPCALPS